MTQTREVKSTGAINGGGRSSSQETKRACRTGASKTNSQMSPPRVLAAMAAHLPRLPFLLFVFLAAHVPASHGNPATKLPTTYDPSMCSESVKCGSVDISYPFYLSNETSETTDYKSNYSCGYTDLNITCLGEGPRATPLIRLGGDNYTVLSISYRSSTITLADSDVLFRDCPAVRHNVTFDEVWLYNTGSFHNLTFFFGCYSKLGDTVPSELEMYRINCPGISNPDGSATLVFRPEQLTKSVEDVLARNCGEIVSMPVQSEVLMHSDQPMLTGHGYGYVLQQGFVLAWGWNRATTDWCRQCDKLGGGGRCAYSQDREFLGCLCNDGTVGDPNCTRSDSRRQKGSKIYIIASTLSLLSCLLILAFFLPRNYCLLSNKRKEESTIESFLQNNGNFYPKRYTYAAVKRMTMSFSVKLGQGGFGDVYRGNLSDGRQVAVKMLKESNGDGEEFMNEVASISRTSHVNVVMLLGFCLQGSKRALIYEYMPNGSLERFAFNRNFKWKNTLTWDKLFNIAIGIARGLEYLHRGCNTRIVHFDIKPHNILLDQDFCPKISDFGLAKLCVDKESALSTVGARGTIGYIAPEVYSKRFGTAGSKSDVYSYGMMVLEMVGARDKNINADSESSSQYFPQWIYENLDDYCISASEINGETTELVRKMILVGLWCIQLVPTHRPTMTRVVEMLEGSTSVLELPPKGILT